MTPWEIEFRYQVERANNLPRGHNPAPWEVVMEEVIKLRKEFEELRDQNPQ